MPKVRRPDGVCSSCQMGKQHKEPLPENSIWRASERLQLVHIDVCGPKQTKSMNKNKYFVLFVDDMTRMTWIYFIRNKSQVFDVFKKFKKLVET